MQWSASILAIELTVPSSLLFSYCSWWWVSIICWSTSSVSCWFKSAKWWSSRKGCHKRLSPCLLVEPDYRLHSVYINGVIGESFSPSKYWWTVVVCSLIWAVSDYQIYSTLFHRIKFTKPIIGSMWRSTDLIERINGIQLL
jgi:hypothetical protein